MRALLLFLATTMYATPIETWSTSELWQQEEGLRDRFQLTIAVGFCHCEDWWESEGTNCGVSIFNEAAYDALIPGVGPAKLSDPIIMWFNGPLWVNITRPDFNRGQMSQVLNIRFGYDGAQRDSDVYSAVFEFRVSNATPTIHMPEPSTLLIVFPLALLLFRRYQTG